MESVNLWETLVRLAKRLPDTVLWIETDVHGVRMWTAAEVVARVGLRVEDLSDVPAWAGRFWPIVGATRLSMLVDELACAKAGKVAVYLPGVDGPRVWSELQSGQIDIPLEASVVLFTSGTTAEPTVVALPARATHFQLQGLKSALSLGPDDSSVSFLPLSHIMGRLEALLPLAGVGPALLLEDRGALAQWIGWDQLTFFIGVPVVFARFATAEWGKRLRFAVSGGLALPDRIREAYANRGITLIDGYGLSEAGGAVSFDGKLFPGVQVLLADDQEILVRSQSLSLSQAPQGCLSSGDIGEWDDSGRLRVIGRKRDCIALLNGFKVHPGRIERELLRSHWVEEVILVGEGRSGLGALFRARRGKGDSEVKLRAIFQNLVSEVNKGLLPQERVRSFSILPAGSVNTTGLDAGIAKENRRSVLVRYQMEIDQLYQGQ